MSRRLILIVEDEETTREVLAQALETFGYKTIIADNGKDALNLFNAHRPDMIISDIYMPVMNGLELLKAVRRTDKTLPFILITGFDIQEAHETAHSHGATALLLKPFRLQQLRDILDRTFNSSV